MAARQPTERPDWRSTLSQALPGRPWRTRFAPAPTGYLHLGHVVNAVHVWGIARAYGGQVVLRVEDHDRTRCRATYEAALLEDLAWLGLVPDEPGLERFGPLPNAYRQSDQGARYGAALAALAARGLVYPCTCSRRDVARLGAPSGDGELRYPGTCRDARVAEEATRARRVRLPDEAVAFTDLRLGAVHQHPARDVGDVLVRDRLGQWTYQFAVVVDDRAHGIDVIIRGEDLLASTGRQRLLRALLGATDQPLVLHHALVRHADGRKLSKAEGDTAIRTLRAQGVSRDALLGEAAWRSGLTATAAPLAPADLPRLFAEVSGSG